MLRPRRPCLHVRRVSRGSVDARVIQRPRVGATAGEAPPISSPRDSRRGAGTGEERRRTASVLLALLCVTLLFLSSRLVVLVDRLVASLLSLPLLLVGQGAGLECARLELGVEALDAQVVLELVVRPLSGAYEVSRAGAACGTVGGRGEQDRATYLASSRLTARAARDLLERNDLAMG